MKDRYRSVHAIRVAIFCVFGSSEALSQVVHEYQLDLKLYTDSQIRYGSVVSHDAPTSNEIHLRIGDLASVQLGLTWNGDEDLVGQYPFELMGDLIQIEIYAALQSDDGQVNDPILLKSQWDASCYEEIYASTFTPDKTMYFDTFLFASCPIEGGCVDYEYAFPTEGVYEVHAVYTPWAIGLDGGGDDSGIQVLSNSVLVTVSGEVPGWEVLKSNDIFSAAQYPFFFWFDYFYANESEKAEIDSAVALSGVEWIADVRNKSTLLIEPVEE
tara:strand:- start:346 stop:1155 length:810 start_codon:yes stop_codon:yes gene_type:complete